MCVCVCVCVCGWVGGWLGAPVMVAPKLFLHIFIVAVAITERGLALNPIDDMSVHSHWYL